MATSAGRILLIPKGNYDAATTYQPLDIVFYNSASYVCKATTLGNAPTNTTYWQIFSEGFDVEQFYANIAPTYNAATTYAAGDHFIYNDVIYTVNVACTGITPPNANYYSVATITGLIEDNTAAISSLNSNLTNKFVVSETKTLTYKGNGTDTLGNLLASAANAATSYLAGLDSDEFVILTNVIVNSSNVTPLLSRFGSAATFTTYFSRLAARNAQTSIGIITGFIGASGSQMITSSIDSGLTISSFSDKTDIVPSTSIFACQLVFERYTPL